MSAPVYDLLTERAEAAPVRPSDDSSVASADSVTAPERIGARLRLLPIPAHEPPLEDSRTPLWRVATPAAPQLALPLRISTRPDIEEAEFGPQLTDRQQLPDPGPWAQRLLQATLESLAGRRSPAQLQYWTSTNVYRGIVQAAQRAHQRRSGRSTPDEGVSVSRVRVCEPADGVAEVCAIVRRDGRWHAIAARLEGIDGRWRCVSLSIG